MKYLYLLICLMPTLAFSQTAINFDTDANWTNANMPGYRSDISYVEGNFVSSSSDGLRETLAVQDGQPGFNGTYAWRMNRNNINSAWFGLVTTGGVNDFSFNLRRFQTGVDLDVEYSIDGGSNWVYVTNITDATLNNSSAYKNFTFSINSGLDNIIVRVKARTNVSERFMIDDVSFTPFTGPCTNTTESIVVVACDVYTVPSGDETYTTSGMYMDTIDNAGGCDSIISIDLTVNQSTSSYHELEGCDSIEFNGVTYYTTGLYTQNLQNSAGCDSNVLIQAWVGKTPKKPVAGEDVGTCFGSDLPFVMAMDDTSAAMLITAVVDGPISANHPRGVEIFALKDIADLSKYGLGTADDGLGSDGEEYTFPAVSLSAGQFITITSTPVAFNTYFGFSADFVDSTSSGIQALDFDGNDAVELFSNGELIDRFGQPDVDGSGQAWAYAEGWAYRRSYEDPNDGTFLGSRWFFSGASANIGATTNANSPAPLVLLSYSNVFGDQFTWYLDEDLTQIISNQKSFRSIYHSVGTYTYYVTNKSGDCVSKVDSMKVEVYELPVIESFETTNVTATPANGSIDVTVSGGTAPYLYTWSNSSNSEDLSFLSTGTYTLVVSDLNGCAAKDSVEITSELGLFEGMPISVVLYPNPSSSGVFHYSAFDVNAINLTVVDLTGQVVWEAKNSPSKGSIDLSAFSNGLYHLTMTTSEGRVHREKLIKN